MHNVATSHVISHRRQRSRQWVTLKAFDAMPDHGDTATVDRELLLQAPVFLLLLVHQANKSHT